MVNQEGDSYVGELYGNIVIQQDSAVGSAVDNLRVSFFPPLQEQRRGWILSVLRKERVRSVVDIGCGEGSLLQCLCNPSRFLRSSNQYRGIESSEDRILQEIQNEEDSELQTTSIMGLDVELESAKRSASSTKPSTERDPLSFPRWISLDVKIFHGSLADYNPEFEYADCIVSTEVIEHLPPSILPVFAPMLLGVYRPRLLLLTTPSYTFNARFSAPGLHDPAGYPDPTHRTSRVFRHADHKFEWTPDEFRRWCEDAASEWGYTVEVGGVGRANEEDPWGRDEDLGWATQVATFRRLGCVAREKGEEREEGEPHASDRPGRGENRESSELEDARHELIAEHHYDAHPFAGKPLPREEIQLRVLSALNEYYTEDGWTIWSLWVEESISTACGGYLQELLGAVLTCTEIKLVREESEAVTRWRVVFSGSRHEEALAKTRREYQGWNASLEEDIDAKSQGNDQVLWEPGSDVWQQRSWTSPEEVERMNTPPFVIGEEVDWGQTSESSWGS
ncbi:hypothetical protein SCHPADRAFT_900941 [Schizopora paradoxa]|uniref:Small RNA 2'-O-methyltransferase n=1 Tax=Schizopora paradoxa TaxID=27342 RepID=A0A0H2RZH6_9AGAM|nr:hypothetical protein SCHPADRAFT_900941 [Schizopora paradoxa]